MKTFVESAYKVGEIFKSWGIFLNPMECFG
jgi:hypothetical protein